MSSLEIFFALFGVALAPIPWALSGLGIAVPRPIIIGGLIVGICSLGGAFAVPAYERWFAPTTYAYFIVGRGLAENSRLAPQEFIPRRIFVLQKRGPAALRDVNVMLHDNRGKGGDYSISYPIVDADKEFPKYFWWPPAQPWNEDYTLRIFTKDMIFRERIIVQTVNGAAEFAIRLTDDSHRPLFSCKDADIPASGWELDNPQQCQKIIPVDPKFSMGFEPTPFVLNLAEGPQITMIDATPNFRLIPPAQETTSDIRRLTEWQRQRLQNSLVKLGKHKMLILFGGGEHTMKYAHDFEEVGKSAHWQIKGPIQQPRLLANITDVLACLSPVDQDTGRQVLELLLEAGVKSARHFQYDFNVTPGTVVLLVGVKSPDSERPDLIDAMIPYNAHPELKELTIF